MAGHALGSIGSGLTGSLTSRYQHAGTAAHNAGDRMSNIASTERTNASNYRNVEEDNAARFRGIRSGHQPPTVHGQGSRTGTDADPGTPPPSPGGSTAPQSAPNLVTGTDTNGNKIQFAPGDVQSIPLHDSNGKLIGVSFPTKPADSTKVPQWAGMNRKSDSEFLPATPKPPAPTTTPAGAPYPQRPPAGGTSASGSGSGPIRNPRPQRPAGPAPKWSYDPPQSAPWSNAGTPVYVHAHANPNAFAVNVNTGTAAAPVWTKVRVDGNTHGQVIAANQHYQQAAGANPNSPLVLMSCSSAKPGGTAASGAAAYLHGHGDGRDVYAPTGTGLRITDPRTNTSSYGVEQTTDINGNTVPGSFQHFPPPAPTPPATPTGGGATP